MTDSPLRAKGRAMRRNLMGAAYADKLDQQLVWGFPCQGCHAIFVFLCHSILLFDPRRRAFFRPDRIFPSPSRAAAVKDGASSAPPKARP